MVSLEPLHIGEEDKRTWKGPWWCCWGGCTPIDWISCCTACWVPCVAYGYVSGKVLNVSFWKGLAKYVAVFGLLWLLQIAFYVGAFSTCPLDALNNSTTTTEKDPPDISQACRRWLVVGQLLRWVAYACVITWAVVVGGPSRSQIRRRLGIPDSGAGGDCCTCCLHGPDKGTASDCCLHFWCRPCALAQEMRTVMHLGSMNQLPLPVPEGYEPLMTQAPAADAGMSRAHVVGVPAVAAKPGSDMV